MKPLGVRFRNFACFEEAYLRLDAGVQILVGRNNAGKTALLRGLSALRLLPVGQSTAIVGPLFSLGHYAAQDSAQRAFGISVDFQFEEGDFAFLKGALPEYQLLRTAANRFFSFDFQYLADENFVVFLNGALTFDENRLLVVERRDQGVFLLHYDQSGERERILYPVEAPVSRSARGQSWPSVPASGIFSALVPLMSVRMIDAHRVVAPELNMQAVEELTPNVQALTQFLDTLSGNNRRKFQQLESFVTRVFPEIEFVNLEKRQNAVSLTLTRRGSDTSIPLSYWGTGVEQVLAIAAFVLTAPSGSMLLLDEPHSYLHPAAEREVIRFLREHPEHHYVISTHSATLINSVPADQIVVLNSNKITREDRTQSHCAAEVLYSLGYRNSDLLFSDRLVFVEGESDQEILPVLLEKSGGISPGEIVRTGFPKMDGEGKLRGTSSQTSLLFFEKFLKGLGSSSLPRIYLFDGDCSEGDRKLVQGTRAIEGTKAASVGFLPRREIENYLLVPAAIAAAIGELLAVDGNNAAPTEDAVRQDLHKLLAADDVRLFPDGRSEEPFRSAKGSAILERIFGSAGLRYRKRNEGKLIAKYVTAHNQPGLAELVEVVRPVFAVATNS